MGGALAPRKAVKEGRPNSRQPLTPRSAEERLMMDTVPAGGTGHAIRWVKRSAPGQAGHRGPLRVPVIPSDIRHLS